MANQQMKPADLERILAALYKFYDDPRYAEHINILLDFASEASGAPRAFLEIALSNWSANRNHTITPAGSAAPVAAEQKNTKINYLYRDASNYKVRNSCVINGVLSKDQMKTILSCLHEGEYFIPSLVGLPEVKFDEYDPEDDHEWFELSEFSFEISRARADISLTTQDLVAAFIKCKGRWEDIYYSIDENAAERVYVLSGKEMSRSEFLSSDIAELDLSVRAYNSLRRAGICTIGRLITLSQSDLLKVRNMGYKCRDEILLTLADHGEYLDPGNARKNTASKMSINRMIANAAAKKDSDQSASLQSKDQQKGL